MPTNYAVPEGVAIWQAEPPKPSDVDQSTKVKSGHKMPKSHDAKGLTRKP